MRFTKVINFITFALLSTIVEGDYTFGRPVIISTADPTVNAAFHGPGLVDNKINSASMNTLLEA